MKKTVLAFSRITPAMAERLQQDFNVILPNPKLGDINAQFNEALPEAHGLIGVGRKLGRAQLEGAARLEVVSSVSVGYDNYDLDYFNERGIALTNTPDVLTESTADLGFSLVMGCARRTAELDAWTKAGNWQATVGPALFGSDVHGKTLGIVGMGNIGAAIARRGRFGFNMPVIYAGNSRKTALEQELGAQFRSLEQLLAEADFVVIVVPLSEATRKLIGAREPETDEAERVLDQHRPRAGGGRSRADRSAAARHHSWGRPGCVRERATERFATVQAAQCADLAAHWFGHCRNP
ncbi:Glyoxylate/hydroxypyruvate reductase B [Pseudomonas sp. MM223]|nr:Glyoxylate/hydroxypyruvate reductase B [Pseudomonas sp. MM223]